MKKVPTGDRNSEAVFDTGNDKNSAPTAATAKKLYTSIIGDVGPRTDTARLSTRVRIGDISDCRGLRTTLSPGLGAKGFCKLGVQLLFSGWLRNATMGKRFVMIYYRLSREIRRRRYHLHELKFALSTSYWPDEIRMSCQIKSRKTAGLLAVSTELPENSNGNRSDFVISV